MPSLPSFLSGLIIALFAMCGSTAFGQVKKGVASVPYQKATVIPWDSAEFDERSLYAGCSVNCMPEPRLDLQSGLTGHSAKAVYDNDGATYWLADSKPGIPARLSVTFDLRTEASGTNSTQKPQPVISGIEIYNGRRNPVDDWTEYARPKTLEVAVDGRPIARLALADTRDRQTFSLPKLLLYGKQTNITLTVLDAYPGRLTTLALTDIAFSGKGVH